MARFKPVSAAAALAACFSLAVPAGAVEFPRTRAVVYDAAHENAANHRRHYRRDRVDAGDVIAGVLILGGIAAIASAASRSRDRVERYPDPYPYPEDPRYRERTRSYESRGMESAVDMCVNEIERGRDRIASVDSAARTGEGWFISGEVEGGAPFTCRIGNDGRIDDVDIGGGYSERAVPGASYDSAGGWDDRQYADDIYYRARSERRGTDAPYAYDP